MHFVAGQIAVKLGQVFLQVVERFALSPEIGIIEKIAEEGTPILLLDEHDGEHAEPPNPVNHKWILHGDGSRRQVRPRWPD
jgi:hypothetical protein